MENIKNTMYSHQETGDGLGCSTCESEEASMHNFNEVKIVFGRLGIDVRIGVILKRNVKWTIFEGLWYEPDSADFLQTARAVCC